MLPPVSAPTVAPAPGKSGTISPNAADRTLPETSARAQAGPASAPPEITEAIDPPKQGADVRRLRDGETLDGRRPLDSLPAGPPPAFVETILERQSRTAFEPAEPTGAARAEQKTEEPAQAAAAFAEARSAVSPSIRSEPDGEAASPER